MFIRFKIIIFLKYRLRLRFWTRNSKLFQSIISYQALKFELRWNCLKYNKKCLKS